MTHDHAHNEKRWYLVSYDIRNHNRWREAHKVLKGIGERVHYSLFRCRVTKTEMEALRWQLEQILEEEDDLMFVHLCPTCAARIQEKGKDIGWTNPVQRYQVL